MKIATLLIALLVSCQVDQQSVGHEPSPMAAQPSVEFRGYELPAGLTRPVAAFELVNSTGSTYTYWEQVGPVFFKYDLGHPNPWDGMLMCGNGVEERSLVPGDAVKLIIGVEGDVGPIQVRMTVKNALGERIELVSREVDLPASEASKPLQRTAFGGG